MPRASTNRFLRDPVATVQVTDTRDGGAEGESMSRKRTTEPSAMTLAQMRALTGLPQKEVGRRMGVGQARVSQIERDFPNLNYAVVDNYIRAIGGRIEFTAVGGQDFAASEIAEDPRAQYGTRR
ncbi:helix-turn-helix domain-containing protein [Streptomyces phaeochromogenes]